MQFRTAGMAIIGLLGLTFTTPRPVFGAASNTLTIHNEKLAVTLDPASAIFSIAEFPSNRVMVHTIKLAAPASATAATRDVVDPIFGAGQMISVHDDQGAGGDVAVYRNLPFAMIRLTMKNTTAQPQMLNRVAVASFDAGDGTGSLRVRGTGGLSEPKNAPGSYEWIAVADEMKQSGIVAGFITHDRATGVLMPSIDAGSVKVDARSEFGRLRIAPGATAQTETLAIGFFGDARLGLEAWADAIARQYNIKLPPQPTGYCTWYSDKHGGSGDEKSIAELSDFTKQQLAPFGFSFIQIDDGWQEGKKLNGPRKNFTGFRPDGPYPAGMKATADRIKAAGFMPGIWFMPFAGTYNDPWFKEHADWFAKHEDGTPFDTAWGGTCLDMTNPAARDYVRSVVKKISGDWGYSYFKLDGMWTGLAAKQVYVNDKYIDDNFGDAVLSNPDKTNIEAIRDGLKLVRETAGPNVFLLGCNIAQNMRAYGGTFGLLDAMRIGPDNNGTWKGWFTSPRFGSRHYFLNGRVWYNDPDPNYLRAKLSADEARTIATWTAVSGQLNTNSDWIPGLPADRLNLLKRTMPAHGRTSRPVDFFETDPPKMWQVTDDRTPDRRNVIAVYNWGANAAMVTLPLSRFDLPTARQYAVFDYWNDQLLPAASDTIHLKLPPHGCADLAIRPMLDHPFVITTNRHITQGMIDLSEEKWDAVSKTLSGTSQVVGGDPYELGIVTPGDWKNPRSSASNAQVKAESAGLLLRVRINAPTTRNVNWKIQFAQ